MALSLWLHRIHVHTQLEALWMLIWIASVASGSTFVKNQPKSKDSTVVPDGQILGFNIVNGSFFTKPLLKPDDFVLTESKSFDEGEVKSVDIEAKQERDNTSVLNNHDTFINPKVLLHQDSKQNVDVSNENDKQNNFKGREQKHISGYHFLITNETVLGSKIENKDPFHLKLNLTSANHTQYVSQGESINTSMKNPIQDNFQLNKSVIEDKPAKTNLSETALFNKYLIAERKKAASHYNSTLPVSKQKIFYHDSSNFNETSLMNDQPVQANISDGKMELSTKSSNEGNGDDSIELSDHNSTTVVDNASNETVHNDSSTAISRIMAENSGISFNTIVITGISLGVVIVAGIMAAGSYVIYRHRYWNKPQTLSDKCSNADSSGYIDDSTLRENSEEMYSLDNDSFLNSLEAMTIQNYWTDNVKHTKL